MCSGSEEGSYLRLIDFESLNSRLEIHRGEKETLAQGLGLRVQGLVFTGLGVMGVRLGFRASRAPFPAVWELGVRVEGLETRE